MKKVSIFAIMLVVVLTLSGCSLFVPNEQYLLLMKLDGTQWESEGYVYEFSLADRAVYLLNSPLVVDGKRECYKMVTDYFVEVWIMEGGVLYYKLDPKYYFQIISNDELQMIRVKSEGEEEQDTWRKVESK